MAVKKNKHVGFGTKNPNSELRQAEGLIRKGKLAEARHILHQLSLDFPQNRQILMHLVNVCYELQDIPNYGRACELLLAIEPKNADVAYGLSGAYLITKHPLMALEAFRNALSNFPDHEKADMAKKEVAKLETGVDKLLVDIGLGGEEGYKIALLHERGQVYLEQAEYVKAREAEATVVQLRPNFVSAYNNLSLLSFLEGNLDEAIQICQQVLNIEADNVHALANLVHYYCLQGDFERAKEFAEILKASKADAWDVLTKKAEGLSYVGDDEGIVQIYEIAKASDDSDLEASAGTFYHWLAVAMMRLGKVDAAREHWQKALDSLISKQLAQENLDDLKKSPAQRHAPWAFHFGQWVTQKTLDELKQVTLASGKSQNEAQISQALQQYFADHPKFINIISALLDRGDRQGREFAFSLALAVKTPEMQAVLREFALSQRGTDDMRHKAAMKLSEAGILPETIRMWLQGKWQEIKLISYEFHEEPTIKHSRQVLKIMAQAISLMKTGDQQKLKHAEVLLKDCLAIEPDSPDLLNNLALCYQYQGQSQEGDELLRENIERFPDYVMSRVVLASGHLKNGELDAAEDLLKPLEQRKRFHFQEFAAFCDTLIELLLAKKQREGAKAWLRMWEGVDPENPAVLKWKAKFGGGLMQKLEKGSF
ncbi:hypothetical protein NIES4101_67560 [Calothrix sp. NIES-4101]|nr:hypothetical protein NIES4101_67560 [Calothrix sp. NIES-4101]